MVPMCEKKEETRKPRLRQLLIERRQQIKLTQSELARRLGRSQSFVSKYEHGHREISVIELLDIARVLDVDPVDIVKTIK